MYVLCRPADGQGRTATVGPSRTPFSRTNRPVSYLIASFSLGKGNQRRDDPRLWNAGRVLIHRQTAHLPLHSVCFVLLDGTGRATTDHVALTAIQPLYFPISYRVDVPCRPLISACQAARLKLPHPGVSRHATRLGLGGGCQAHLFLRRSM